MPPKRFFLVSCRRCLRPVMMTAGIADMERIQLSEHLRACAPAELLSSIRSHFRVIAH
jgi:hypothetical protein